VCLCEQQALGEPYCPRGVRGQSLVLPHLKSNRVANGCAFQIIDKALAYNTDTVTFSPGWILGEFSLLQRRPAPVTVIRLANHILQDSG